LAAILIEAHAKTQSRRSEKEPLAQSSPSSQSVVKYFLALFACFARDCPLELTRTARCIVAATANDTMTDAELVTAARAGDDLAWEAVMRAHEAAAFRLAYLLLGDADDAADVAQEAFIRAYRALERFDVSRPLRPWLLRITANLARNRQRSLGRYLNALRRLVSTDPDLDEKRRGEHLSAALRARTEAQAAAHTLWQAVRRLNAAEQEIIYLRYFLELSEAEAASTLEMPPGTVKSRTHRALARLRELVTREYPSLRESLDD
jgi:RNA polymerase sigma-70 factor (ECF subfamily)